MAVCLVGNVVNISLGQHTLIHIFFNCPHFKKSEEYLQNCWMENRKMNRQNLTCLEGPGMMTVRGLQEREWELVLKVNSPVGQNASEWDGTPIRHLNTRSQAEDINNSWLYSSLNFSLDLTQNGVNITQVYSVSVTAALHTSTRTALYTSSIALFSITDHWSEKHVYVLFEICLFFPVNMPNNVIGGKRKLVRFSQTTPRTSHITIHWFYLLYLIQAYVLIQTELPSVYKVCYANKPALKDNQQKIRREIIPHAKLQYLSPCLGDTFMQAVGSENLQPLARVVHLTAHENEGPLHGGWVLQLLTCTQLFSQQCLSELHNHMCRWNAETKHKALLNVKYSKQHFYTPLPMRPDWLWLFFLHRFEDLGGGKKTEQKSLFHYFCLWVAYVWTWWQTWWAKLVFLTLHPQQRQSSSRTGKALSRVRWWQF